MNYYTSRQILQWRIQQLKKGGRKEDLDWLLDLGGGLRWSDLQNLYLDDSKSCHLSKTLDELSSIWRLHLDEKIPLQYLLKICPWRDFEVLVTPAVMIPRQDTELLIDIALEKIKNSREGIWADLGSGSGVLAIALARSLANWEGHVVDINKESLSIAQSNLQSLVSDAKYTLHLGKWWEPLKPWWGNLNLVVSNPPYIPSSILSKLDPFVYLNEPHLALSGGFDGLDCLREIIAGSIDGLSNGGCLILEHHYDQSEEVLNLMKGTGLVDINFERDLQGVKRFAIGFKNLES